MRKTGLRLWLAALALGAAAGDFPAHAELSSPLDSPFVVDVWNTDTEAHLPQNSVISVIQSRDGYLWLGTQEGLVRFDGVRFTVFDDNSTPGLKNRTIVYLFEDSRTNLWIGTETAGVALVQDGQVRDLSNIGGGSRDGRLVSACEDATGAVWLYTADGQLWRYKAGQTKQWDFRTVQLGGARALAVEPEHVWVGSAWGLTSIIPPAELNPTNLVCEPFPANRLDFILTSAEGGYWRLADGRIQKCRDNTLEEPLGSYPWTNATVSCACEDRDGNLIAGTLNETSGDGVYWFGPDGQASRISKSEGLSADGILSLCVDREGDLWVGTDGGGLNRVRRRRFHLVPEIKDWVVQSVCADAASGLWIGAFSGQVGYWHGGTLRSYELLRDSPRQPTVRAIFVDHAGQVWAGTARNGLFQLRGDHFEPVPGPPTASAIYEDHRGILWVGTQNGLVHQDGDRWKVFTKTDGLTSDVVRAIADDTEGNLWIGTEGGGLNRLRDGQFTPFRKSQDGLPSDHVSALLVDSNGVLWVGTAGGLARFAGGKWTRYTTREGLVSSSIAYLLEDGEGDLWLGSNAGLMRVPFASLNDFAEDPTETISCRAYDRADGLPTRECTFGSQPAAWRMKDGELWFPSIKGLVGVRPTELKPNPFPPPVVIESVFVEGRSVGTNKLRAPPPTSATLPPRKARLEIHYTSLNLAASDRARFRYRMDGYDADWTDAGNRRVAPYQKLDPGHYTFEVLACNEDGVWSESPATLAITVEPPFWLTWWFMTASAMASLGAVVGTVHLVSTQKLKRQLRQQATLEKERSRIARDLHDQLGANLTQVSLLGELVEADKDLPDEVEAHAQQITQTSRETTRALDEIVWATNPANDTLEGLINYVCKYAQDYLALAGLRYRLEVPSQLPVTPLLPEVRHNVFLAAKEAVNNVVKHAQASSAWVRLRLETGQVTLEIEDDGRGLPDAARSSTRNGLKNMRKRLEDVGGSFTIEPAPKHGTIVRLTVPLRISDFGLRISS